MKNQAEPTVFFLCNRKKLLCGFRVTAYVIPQSEIRVRMFIYATESDSAESLARFGPPGLDGGTPSPRSEIFSGWRRELPGLSGAREITREYCIDS